jgi:hypothetical protein
LKIVITSIPTVVDPTTPFIFSRMRRGTFGWTSSGLLGGHLSDNHILVAIITGSMPLVVVLGMMIVIEMIVVKMIIRRPPCHFVNLSHALILQIFKITRRDATSIIIDLISNSTFTHSIGNFAALFLIVRGRFRSE